MPLPHYRLYSVNLALGGPPQRISVSGRFIRCLESDERFLISLNGQSPMPLQAGQGWNGLDEVVTEIMIETRAGASVAVNQIEIAVGSSPFEDNRITFTSGVRTVSASALDGSVGSIGVSSVSNTLLIAANASRRCVRFTNESSVACRLSSVAADLTAGAGEILGAREVREIFVTGEIYGRAAGVGCTVNVSAENY